MHWLGPYHISTTHSGDTFSLYTLNGVLIPKAINGFHLKPYFGIVVVPPLDVGYARDSEQSLPMAPNLSGDEGKEG